LTAVLFELQVIPPLQIYEEYGKAIII